MAATQNHTAVPPGFARPAASNGSEESQRRDESRPLADADIEAIVTRTAIRVLELLGQQRTGAFQLLEPKELARALNVSVDYVYAHAADLGVMRLGDGPKARLRFDLATAEEALRARKQLPARSASRR